MWWSSRRVFKHSLRLNSGTKAKAHGAGAGCGDDNEEQ